MWNIIFLLVGHPHPHRLWVVAHIERGVVVGAATLSAYLGKHLLVGEDRVRSAIGRRLTSSALLGFYLLDLAQPTAEVLLGI